VERFARLYAELDATTATGAKVAALRRYFAEVPPASSSRLGLAEWVEQRLLPLRGLPLAEQAQRVAAYWRELDAAGRFLLVKLIGGAFRVGVSKLLVQRAPAEQSGLASQLVAQRMMGYTDIRAAPDAERYLQLVSPQPQPQPLTDAGQPYPFFLAHAGVRTGIRGNPAQRPAQERDRGEVSADVADTGGQAVARGGQLGGVGGIAWGFGVRGFWPSAVGVPFGLE
jgi:hypothetical protein